LRRAFSFLSAGSDLRAAASIAGAAVIRRDHAGVTYPCHIMTLNHFTDPSTNPYRRFAGSHEEVENVASGRKDLHLGRRQKRTPQVKDANYVEG
jgi:hypothetical protein